MSEPRAQRTLVKSPPELWAEISDVSTLARHLGEFGEIRITRLEAETTVVWEGDRARGTVNLEPSGWGTKVTITAEAIALPDEEAEPGPETQAVEPEAAEPEPEPETQAAEPEAAEPEPEPEAVEPEPEPARRGFFARLFARRARPVAVESEPDPEPVAAAEPEPDLHTPTVAAPVPEPEPEPVVAPALEGEIAASAAPAPALDDERVEAVLVGVLDDLGSAHHRPFSRG